MSDCHTQTHTHIHSFFPILTHSLLSYQGGSDAIASSCCRWALLILLVCECRVCMCVCWCVYMWMSQNDLWMKFSLLSLLRRIWGYEATLYLYLFLFPLLNYKYCIYNLGFITLSKREIAQCTYNTVHESPGHKSNTIFNTIAPNKLKQIFDSLTLHPAPSSSQHLNLYIFVNFWPNTCKSNITPINLSYIHC